MLQKRRERTKEQKEGRKAERKEGKEKLQIPNTRKKKNVEVYVFKTSQLLKSILWFRGPKQLFSHGPGWQY